MTADIERLVRQAMRDAAFRALGDDSEIPPFPEPVRPAPRRTGRSAGMPRFAPLTVAAAVLAVLAGGTVAVAVLTAHHVTAPATNTTPSPVATSPAPAPVTPSLALDAAYAPRPAVAGTAVTFTVHGTGSTAETNGHIDYPVVSFGDGTADAVPGSVDPGCSGTPVPIDDTFTVPHTYSRAGSYQVTVTIGSCGLTRTTTLTVEVSPR